MVLKAAYKKCPAPLAQEYGDLAVEAYGHNTDATVANVKQFFRERRLQDFAKKEAALKRKVSPPFREWWPMWRNLSWAVLPKNWGMEG